MGSLTSLSAAALLAGNEVYNATAKKRGQVQFLAGKYPICVFDLQKSEQYKYSAKATRLPVEGGSNATDHVIKDPFGMELECLITDTPLRDSGDGKTQGNDPSSYAQTIATSAGAAAVSAVAGPLGVLAALGGQALYDSGSTKAGGAFSAGDEPTPRSTTAYNDLRRAWEQSTLLTVKTKLGTYPNMIIENLTIPRDNKTGDALVFSISLTTINIVKAQSVDAKDVANARIASKKTPGGAQETNPADPQFKTGLNNATSDFGSSSPASSIQQRLAKGFGT